MSDFASELTTAVSIIVIILFVFLCAFPMCCMRPLITQYQILKKKSKRNLQESQTKIVTDQTLVV